jgi:hypothetical protein
MHDGGATAIRAAFASSVLGWATFAILMTNLFRQLFSTVVVSELPSIVNAGRNRFLVGIKVTIIEPGGFRTDFAGTSTELREGRPVYDATVGATVRFQRDYHGKQPGDPVRAAAALLHVASLSEPPLRLLLGRDAYHAAEKHALQILASDREWKDLSISTDYKLPDPT